MTRPNTPSLSDRSEAANREYYTSMMHLPFEPHPETEDDGGCEDHRYATHLDTSTSRFDEGQAPPMTAPNFRTALSIVQSEIHTRRGMNVSANAFGHGGVLADGGGGDTREAVKLRDQSGDQYQHPMQLQSFTTARESGLSGARPAYPSTRASPALRGKVTLQSSTSHPAFTVPPPSFVDSSPGGRLSPTWASASASTRTTGQERHHSHGGQYDSSTANFQRYQQATQVEQQLQMPTWFQDMATDQSSVGGAYNSHGSASWTRDGGLLPQQAQHPIQDNQQESFISTEFPPPPPPPPQASIEDTLEQEVIMAINVRGRTLGCAYFDGQLSTKLFVMQDMSECLNTVTDIVQTIKAQIRPALILTSARLDEAIVAAVRIDETGRETKVDVRPGGDFAFAVAKSKLISVCINAWRSRTRSSLRHGYTTSTHMDRAQDFSGMDETAQREALLQLSKTIDLQSVESIGCAGAIISLLSRHGMSHRAAKGGGTTMLLTVESFTLESFMFINANSLSSLQIFEDESHPSMHNSIRGRKEGLSLFGVLNQAKTPQGKYLLKQWLLRPSLDLNVIYARHQSVECFVRTENQPTVGQLVNCLSHVKNIPKVLQALPRKATIAEWQAVLQVIDSKCLKIHSGVQEILTGESPIIHEILQKFEVQNLMDIGAFIHDVIDFDESVIEGRCVVKHSVDEELDRMRQTYHGLDNFLSEIAKEISQTIPSDFTSTINVIYFPQLGYLITVPMNPEWKTEQDYHLQGLSYQFSTMSTVYYKNSAMRDREIDILQGLQERILEYSQLLVICSDLCAELDVLISFSQVARVRNYRRPQMTERNVLWIANGRHPLQELVVDSFVANSTQLGELDDTVSTTPTVPSNVATTSDSTLTDIDTDAQGVDDGSHQGNRVLILSGANSSGKSAYLKQVALITYMAHVGSFVPADSAVVGLRDKILTRLQTRETVSSIQSAFMTDLQQVALALKLATKRSLVVLDEFGKGTASADGAGMFCGVIEHFAKRHAQERPMVLATTHFHELFENQLLDLNLPISLFTMEVYQEPNCLETAFLFRVIPGITPSSLGPACAAIASMPTPIVQRSMFLSGLFRRYEMVIPMLTEREQKMQRMYEQMAGMLLHLDLDVETSQGLVADPVRISTKWQTSATDGDDDVGNTENATRDGAGTRASIESVDGSSSQVRLKRKRKGAETDDSSTEVEGYDCHLALNQLLQYVAEVYREEQADEH
ncbi:MutS protein msh5 [Dissophora globulifera]|uniref:MutS protein msh5 n=1 Tax=Dissophora globulifera TaxID=979702 RepID=A0A9P6RVN1_9FUNG|nr:MutS protein msh5 [Dissophora globulifera]